MGNDPFSLEPYTGSYVGSGGGGRSEFAESLSRPASESQVNFVAAIIVAIAGFIFGGPFIPLILTSLALGWLLWSVRYQMSEAQVVKGYLSLLAIVGVALFVLFGSPIGFSGQRFFGIAWGTKACNVVLDSFMRFWNGFFTVEGLGEIGRNINQMLGYFRIHRITRQALTLYAWALIPVSVLFSGGFLFLERFFGIEIQSNALKRAPVTATRAILKLPGLVLVQLWAMLGFKSVSVPTKPLGKWCLSLALLAFVYSQFANRAFLVFYWWNHEDPVLLVLMGIALTLPMLGALAGLAFGLLGPKGETTYRAVFGRAPTLRDLSADFGGSLIASGKGFLLGKTFSGYPYELSDQNLAYHVEIVAPTGSGKTNLLKNLISDRVKRGHTVIFFDFKADFDVVNWMYGAAKSADRESDLRFLSLSDRELSVPYNPIKYGSGPEIHSQIMGSFAWSHEFYHARASDALLTITRGLAEYRDKTGELFHLGHVHTLFSKAGKLRTFAGKCAALKLPAAEDLAELASKLDRPQEAKEFAGLISKLNILVHSAAGPLLTEDVKSGTFDFREAIDQGRITCVLINSMKLRESADVLGKIILQDLISLVGDRFSKRKKKEAPVNQKPITLVIDEFASFAIPEFAELLDRIRGAGIGVIMAHQSRSDLRKLSDDFQKRIEANCNTVIVSGVKDSDDAEYYAGILGTQTTKKTTTQVQGWLFWKVKTGMESEREVEEFKVHPNKLKALEQGQVFTVSQTIDPKWGLVNVAKAQEFDGVDENAVEQAMAATRDRYMGGGQEQYLDLSLGDQPSGQKVNAAAQKEEVREAPLWE